MRVRMLSVNCILEVKYCITGVNVYMDMNFFDKNLTDLSYLTAFFCIVNLMVSLQKRKKGFRLFWQKRCALSQYHFMCVREGVWVSACVQFNSDIWLFWCNKVCLL